MQRILSLPVLVLGLLACGTSVAEGDTATDPCWEALVYCADTESTEEVASSDPTIATTAKDTGVWIKERFLRHVRVDPESYPQRPHSKPSS